MGAWFNNPRRCVSTAGSGSRQVSIRVRRLTASSTAAAVSPEEPRSPALARWVERIGRHGGRDRTLATPAEDDDVEFRVVRLDHEIITVQYPRYHPPQGSGISAVDFLIERDGGAVRHIERRIQRGKHVCDRGPADVESNCRRITPDAYRGATDVGRESGAIAEIGIELRWRPRLPAATC